MAKSPSQPDSGASRPSDSSAPALRCVYGPVTSWRFGRSLGIDLLLQTSICSFNCIYCQLGRIERITTRQDVYVPTDDVLAELRAVNWNEVDVVTFSGSGEPTLALNLGEVIRAVKDLSGKPVLVLSNSTLFQDSATRARVLEADRVVCKLDVASQAMLERFNQPAPGLTLTSIVEGIKRLRKEYRGILALQCMFMPVNLGEAEGVARLAAEIQPDEIQVNTPRRPHPREWKLVSRGAHTPQAPPPEGVALPVVSEAQLANLEALMERGVPRAKVISAVAGR